MKAKASGGSEGFYRFGRHLPLRHLWVHLEVRGQKDRGLLRRLELTEVGLLLFVEVEADLRVVRDGTTPLVAVLSFYRYASFLVFKGPGHSIQSGILPVKIPHTMSQPHSMRRVPK